MALLTWKSEFSVNVRAIDEQHKGLVEMINKLHEAMKEARGDKALGQILQDLINYTKTHFAYEERLMSGNGYPGLAPHKVEHDNLTRQVIELEQKFRQGKMFITMEVLSFLKNWLTTHIQGTDKKYSEFFNSRGIA